jgi:hypothetical protein
MFAALELFTGCVANDERVVALELDTAATTLALQHVARSIFFAAASSWMKMSDACLLSITFALLNSTCAGWTSRRALA